MKVLLIEDEIPLAQSIIDYLKGELFICEHVTTIHDAKDSLHMYSYDAILLDLMLPDGNGLDLLQYIKLHYPQVNVLLISAQNELNVKLNGLNGGADDYITKPFAMAELVARLKVINRRKIGADKNSITIGNLVVDLDGFIVSVNDLQLNLTKKEFNVLLYFINNKNRVLSKQAIACHLWGDYTDNLDNLDFVYQHVKNLRKKLIDAGVQDYIKTIYGIGYKFELL